MRHFLEAHRLSDGLWNLQFWMYIQLGNFTRSRVPHGATTLVELSVHQQQLILGSVLGSRLFYGTRTSRPFYPWICTNLPACLPACQHTH